MRPSIEERMERQLMNARIFNNMFDIGVSAVEVSMSTVATEMSDNQYSVTADTLTTYITCSDSDWSTISVGIDYQSPTGTVRVADLAINSNGTYEENYHSIPRAIRTTVYGIIDDVIDEVTNFIDNFDPNAVTESEGE